MDPNAFDLAGIPTTLAIIGALVLIVSALRLIHKMQPNLAERIKDATPWMGWTEKETEQVPVFITHSFHPLDR